MRYEPSRTSRLRPIGVTRGNLIILLLCLLLLKPTHPPATEKHISVNTPLKTKRLASAQDPLSDFQKTDFYRTIIDHNLFRPIGWTPPRPREPYRLLGTLISADGNIQKRAILQRTTSACTATVTIGETLDGDTTVTDIQSKQVTLEKDGRQRTLKLNTFSDTLKELQEMFIRKHWIPLSVFLVILICVFCFFVFRPQGPGKPIFGKEGLPSVVGSNAKMQQTSESERQSTPPIISYEQYRRDHKAWREKFEKAHTEWDQALQDFLNASTEFKGTLRDVFSDAQREQALAKSQEALEGCQAASEKLERIRQEEPVPPTLPQSN